MTDKILSTAEVARKVGVHRDTLLRWLRAGVVPEPKRDRNGWRVFTAAEAQAVLTFALKEPEGSYDVSPSAPAAGAEIARLRSINWDFVDAKTSYLTHGMHPYPAKFIPQIPNALIQELSSVGETVVDLFCGSGTTLVESLLLKRNAIGIDANPLACLISKAKATALSEIDIAELQLLAATVRELAYKVQLTSEGQLFSNDAFRSNAWRPDHSATTFWFKPHVVEELAECLSIAKQVTSESARNLALVSFSSIVVSVSLQDSDTRYVRRSKEIPAGDTCRRFAKALESAIRAAIELTDTIEPRFKLKVLEADLLANPEIGQVDLVVCSPPYPNAYSYHLYHMTRMLWLGMDQPRFKREEIGSHRKYSSKSKGAATSETFAHEFQTIFELLRKHLRVGRYACFVIGDSTVRGERVENASLIAKAGKPAGFTEVARINRNLQSTRKAFNPAIGKIREETILILQNNKTSQ